MSTTRRHFIQASAAAALGSLGLSSLGAAGLPQAGASPVNRPAIRPMRLLILGGTGFIGPHMVRTALDGGHEVTIFNRGRTNTDLFPNVENLIGDRDGDLESLKGRDWDAVIDNTGYVPRHVRDSAELLKGHVGRYLFTSTVSVYDPQQELLTEDADLLDVPEPDSEDVSKYYGELKVLCEQAVREHYGEAATIVRPHIVAGPGDRTDRYTYWPVRIDHGGEVICPGSPDQSVHYIDVRDLSEFCLNLVEQNTPGTYNGAGPTYNPLSMSELIYAIRGVTATAVDFSWLDASFLAERDMGVFSYPLWVPDGSEYHGYSHVSNQRSVAAGLQYRPLAVTAHDTLDWFRQQPQERREKLQLHLKRDAELLAAWKAQ